jgi:hypothetical protein
MLPLGDPKGIAIELDRLVDVLHGETDVINILKHAHC